MRDYRILDSLSVQERAAYNLALSAISHYDKLIIITPANRSGLSG